ncbi:Tic22-like protein [Chloropicon roscoffensis]|uniref:Tic22-like protein n=1 Tax=Chloropicon roscoffensis TaxID=1461544 RepID=A0AAX4PKW6_9CHLO
MVGVVGGLGHFLRGLRGGEREEQRGAAPSFPRMAATEAGPAAGCRGRRTRAKLRTLRSSTFEVGAGRDAEVEVPMLVRRREPKWLSANRILQDRLGNLRRKLASISHNAASKTEATPRPGDQVLASIPEGDVIARRLKDVPVYTVTSNDNFVLLQEEEESKDPTKSMLMLFMSASDAKNFKETVVDKQSMLKPIIGTLFMDKVFKLHMQARPKELENVALRLMPDRKQVEHAFAAYTEAGKPLHVLPGVPVFQAEGLTMRSGDKTMIPLFFGREELDYALQQAFGKSPVTPAVAYKRQWFSRQKERVAEVAKTPFPFLYNKIWKEDDEKAKQHIQRLEKKQQQLNQEQPKRPTVQVGSFEDVLHRMLYEKDSTWDNVMFIPQNTQFK